MPNGDRTFPEKAEATTLPTKGSFGSFFRSLVESIRQNYSTILYGVFLLGVGSMLFSQIRTGYAKEHWHVTEWLINYQGGFVRRGLSGEVLYQLYALAGAPPYYVLLGLNLVLYAALAIFFYRGFCRNCWPVSFLPYPFLLGGPIIDDFWLRKDILIMVLFTGIIKFACQNKRSSWVTANLLLTLAMLIHESVGFFCLPMLMLIFLHGGQPGHWANHAPKAAAKLLPGSILFIVILQFHGTSSIAEEIWESWRHVPFPHGDLSIAQPPAALNALTWPLSHALLMGRDTLNNMDGGIYAPLAWTLIILLIYTVLSSGLRISAPAATEARTMDATNVQTILLFQFIGIIPLFILGWDYGRWVFLWTCSSLAVALIVPEPMQSQMLPRVFRAAGGRLGRFCHHFISSSPTAIRPVAFMVGVPVCSWSVKLFVSSMPLCIALQMVSMAAIKVAHYFHFTFRLPAS